MTNQTEKQLLFKIALSLCLTFAGLGLMGYPSAPLAQEASADWISTGAHLLIGDQASGEMGDLLLENDRVAVVISAIGHSGHYAMSGGNVIDVGGSSLRIDELSEFYTYFDDDWPRQAIYQSLSIVADGSGGSAAVVRAAGTDADDPQLAVVTDYTLAPGQGWLEITTTLTNNGGGNYAAFEAGDAFAWGSCRMFAPGLGFNVSGTITEPWLVGDGEQVSYGYVGSDGDIWGPNGNGWSDMNVTTLSLPPGGSASYSRHLTVAGPDVASAVELIHQVRGTDVGALTCAFFDADSGAPIPDAWAEAFDDQGEIYLQMEGDGTGGAGCTLPPGFWRILAQGPAHEQQEHWLTIDHGGNHHLDIHLGVGSTSYPQGDTLSLIQRPLPNIPSIVTPGDTLTIFCEAGLDNSGWSASLQRGVNGYPLQLLEASWEAETEWWRLLALIPTDVPLHQELFDLRVDSQESDDVTHHAVRVIPTFRDDYYFIHITDTHLPTHLYWYQTGADTDSSEMVDLRTIIEDVALINPEFVLHTGDLVNEGELEVYLQRRYFSRAQAILGEFTVPYYLVGGNHDLGGWNDTPPPAGTARKSWWQIFGWGRLDDPPAGSPCRTQNYSFDYGPVHFIGLEAYNNYDQWRLQYYGYDSFTARQMQWLQQDLADASGSQSRVLFHHKDFQDQLNLSSLGIEMALWGHIHSNSGNINQQPWNLATDNTCDGARSYRLIRVSNGVLNPRPTISAGGNGTNLRVNYQPANDGSNDTVTAQIVNTFSESFENGHLRILMPAGSGTYEVTGGELLFVEDRDSLAVCHIEVAISASTGTSVTVEFDPTAVGEETAPVPVTALRQNHPNPFNPSTRLSFDLARRGEVLLTVHDLNGRLLTTLIRETLDPGLHRLDWRGQDDHGRELPSGVYLVRLSSAGNLTSRKVTLCR